MVLLLPATVSHWHYLLAAVAPNPHQQFLNPIDQCTCWISSLLNHSEYLFCRFKRFKFWRAIRFTSFFLSLYCIGGPFNKVKYMFKHYLEMLQTAHEWPPIHLAIILTGTQICDFITQKKYFVFFCPIFSGKQIMQNASLNPFPKQFHRVEQCLLWCDF